MIKNFLISTLVFGLILICSCDTNFYFGDIYGTFVDLRDNQTYNTVCIGNQVWMTDNLRYDTKDNNSMIYNNITINDTNNFIFRNGRLYNRLAFKKAIPVGWRIPTGEDIVTLYKNLNVSYENAVSDLKILNFTKSGSGYSNGIDIKNSWFYNISGMYWLQDDNLLVISDRVSSDFNNSDITYFSIKLIKE